jgi:hypothetical protein
MTVRSVSVAGHAGHPGFAVVVRAVAQLFA